MFGRHHPVVVMTPPPFVLGGPSALCQRKKIRFLTIQGAKGLVIQGRTVNGSDRCFSDGHAGASLLLDGRSGGSSVFELALDSIVVIDSEVVLSGSDFCAAGEQQLTVRAIRSRVVVEYARFSSFSLVLSEWSKLAGNSFVSAETRSPVLWIRKFRHERDRSGSARLPRLCVEQFSQCCRRRKDANPHR